MKVEVAQSVQLDLPLEIGTLAETVEVTAAAAQLQTSDSQIGGVVESKAISDLPLNGRNFTQLMVLMAGSTERAGGTVAGHYVERAGGTAFSVNGQRQTRESVSDQRLHGEGGPARDQLDRADHRRAAGVPCPKHELHGGVRNRGRRADQRRHEVRHQRFSR